MDFSYGGRVAVAIVSVLILMAGIAAGAVYLNLPAWLTFLIVLLVGIPIGVYAADRITRPLNDTLDGVTIAIARMSRGSAMNISVIRITTSSMTPPK